MLMEARINPVLRIREHLEPEVLRNRLERTQRMLKGKHLSAMIVQRDWQNCDRWLNNIFSFGAPAGGWYIIPADGIAMATNGFRLEKDGEAAGREGLALYDEEGSLVDWLTDCDLLDMLGDKLDRDGMEYDQDLFHVRNGNAKLITGFGWKNLRDILGGRNEIGVVDPENMRCDLYDELSARFPGIRMTDVTTEFAALQAVKEPDEIQVFREIAKQHDRILEGCMNALRPDETERETANRARYLAYHYGCAGFNWKNAAEVRMFSTPADTDAVETDLLYPGRMLRKGDRISIQVSAMGMSGYYGMICRSFLLGKKSSHAEAGWKDAVEATDLCAEYLRPGSSVEAAGQAVTDMLKAKGYQAPEGTFISSLGYGRGQLPAWGQPSAGMRLEPGMVFAVCPPVKKEGQMPYCCGDMYMVTNVGTERLTRFPREPICR